MSESNPIRTDNLSLAILRDQTKKDDEHNLNDIHITKAHNCSQDDTHDQYDNSLPRLKCAIPSTPINVASKLLGASIAQYVAAATHIRCTDNDSIASNGKHHQEFLKKKHIT